MTAYIWLDCIKIMHEHKSLEEYWDSCDYEYGLEWGFLGMSVFVEKETPVWRA